MTAPRDGLHELLELSIDELFQRLGYSYGRSGVDEHTVLRETPPNREVEQAKGEKLFAELQPKIVQKLCKEWNACDRLRKGEFVSADELVAAVADVLSAVIIGVPVIVISVLVAKVGIRNICNCE